MAVLASNISIPPLIPLIVFLSYETGIIWMGSKGIHMSYDTHMSLEGAKKNFLQYVLGSFTLGAMLAFISWVATYIVVKTFKKLKSS